MTTETKKGLICLTLGVGLAFTVMYLIKKEKKESGEDRQPAITDESILVAVNAYKSGMDAGESKENLEEINDQLKEEFGVSVEFKPLQNKYIVRDLSGKKIKEV